MRGGNNTSTGGGVGGNGGFGHWKSPIPYLFGGLGLMLGLITIALMILACSHKRTYWSQKSGEQEEDIMKVEMEEPEIVVIMAGHQNPTYLAMPKPQPQPLSISLPPSTALQPTHHVF